MKTLTLAVGFAAGYVLGSRAGRERYQEIVAKVQEFTNKPAVVQAQAKAKDLVDQGTRAVTGKLSPDTDTTAPAPTASRSIKSSTGSPSAAVNGTI